MHRLIGECEFFQAIRILQKSSKLSPKIGYAKLPKDEPVRFGQIPTLACAGTLVDSYEQATENHPSRMYLTFHGLFGANGPLPLNYTEFALDRLRSARDATFSAFLDIFHHRMITFLARAWADNNIAVDMDRPDESRFKHYVASLIGMGSESVWNTDELPDHARLYYSGWLSRATRSPEGLGKILGSYFHADVEIQPFQGRWIEIPGRDRTRLGCRTSSVLGRSVIAGERTWDCRLSFRVKFGPLTYSRYKELQPGGSCFKKLCCWIKTYTGDEYFWDVSFKVIVETIPTCRLGDRRELGYNIWLKSKAGEEVDEVSFQGSAVLREI